VSPGSIIVNNSAGDYVFNNNGNAIAGSASTSELTAKQANSDLLRPVWVPVRKVRSSRRAFGQPKTIGAAARRNVDFREELIGSCPGNFDDSAVTERNFLKIEG
jgi:hypothetical protein